MYLINWGTWFALAFGIVYLIVGASITSWPRRFLFNLLGPKWGGPLACAPCCSFWVGIAMGLPVRIVWLHYSSWWIDRIYAGFILMGLIVLVQLVTHSLIAEIGRDANA